MERVCCVEDGVFRQVALGLGANGPAAAAVIAAAVGQLRSGGLAEVQVAPLYETAPVDCEAGTPPFANTAVVGWWRGPALALLDLCLEVERLLGRPARHSSREARAIDIDVLLFDCESIRNRRLIVPHERMCGRLFVLVPLADIAPNWPIPPSMDSVAVCRDRLLAAPTAAGWGRRVGRLEI